MANKVRKGAKGVEKVFISFYNSILGKIGLKSDGEFLTGLWFVGSKDELKQNVGCERTCECGENSNLNVKVEKCGKCGKVKNCAGRRKEYIDNQIEINDNLPIFKEVAKWLDVYFSGQVPNFVPKYKIVGATAFQAEVIAEVEKIPYGKVVTYGDIAKVIASKRGLRRMSAQAVGGAVGWNPVCLIVPCHRVVGVGGKLVGYGGGIENKIKLLQLEKIKILSNSFLCASCCGGLFVWGVSLMHFK